jgi:hypothetical protein
MLKVVMITVQLMVGQPPVVKQAPMPDLATCMEHVQGLLSEAVTRIDGGSKTTYIAGCQVKVIPGEPA